MMNKSIFLFLACILSANGLFAQEEAALETYEADGFSISYPAHWNFSNNGQMGTSFILSTESSSKEDAFSENVNLLKQDLSGFGLDLDGFTKLSEEQIKAQMVNGEIIESKTLNKNGTSIQEVIFLGDQNGRTLKFKQYYRIVNDTAYVLTYTAVLEDFDLFHIEALLIMDSLKIK